MHTTDGAGGPAGRADERLDSWKAVASYLGRAVTTVQRWEREESLPIHRHVHASKGSVYALKGELDEWRLARTQLSTSVQRDGAPAEDLREPRSQLWRGRSSTMRAVAVSLCCVTVAAVGFAWMATRSRGVPPQSPVTLVASSPRPGTVVLEWSDNSPDESRFEARRFDAVVGSFSANVTRAAFNGLDAGTNYHWDVRACNASGCSAWHGVVGRTPDGASEGVSKSSRISTDIVFASDRVAGRLQIWLMTATGGSPVRLTDSPAHDYSPVWSPDRKRIAFVSDRTRHLELFVMDADGSNQMNLTKRDPANDSSPAWSPDGGQIAFASSRSRDWDIWVMRADGSSPVNRTNAAGDDTQPAWSRDGTRIAFMSNRDGANDIYVMNADGSGQRRLTFDGADNMAPSWSPDDRRIGFTSRRGGTYDVMLMDADGGRPTNLTNHGANDTGATWSPDGSRIAFRTDRDGNFEIYSVAADGSGLVNLTSIRGLDTDPDWGLPRSQRVLAWNLFAPRSKVNRTGGD